MGDSLSVCQLDRQFLNLKTATESTY